MKISPLLILSALLGCVALCYPASNTQAGELKLVRALLMPQARTTLSSQISGKISKLTVKDGDSFKHGTMLVKLDCSIQYGNLARAKAMRDAATRKLENEQQLRNYGSGSELELGLAQDELKRAKADISIAQAQIRMCTVAAPFSGHVVELKAQPYQSVSAGTELVEIIDSGPLDIQLIIPSMWLSWLKKGAKFRIKIDENGKIYTANITKLGNVIDAASQTIKIYGAFENNHPELIAGMSGKASFMVPDE